MKRLPLIFAALGLVVFVASCAWAWGGWRSDRIEASWPETEAVIDSCVEARDPDTGYTSFHFYAHRAMPDGRRHDFEGYSHACTSGPYRVRYDPANPTTLAHLHGSRSYFAAMIPAFIGLAFMYLGTRVWWTGRAAATGPST